MEWSLQTVGVLITANPAAYDRGDYGGVSSLNLQVARYHSDMPSTGYQEHYGHFLCQK